MVSDYASDGFSRGKQWLSPEETPDVAMHLAYSISRKSVAELIGLARQYRVSQSVPR